jgi:hypothetical protein
MPPWIIYLLGWAGPLLGLAFGEWEERAWSATTVVGMLISYACGFVAFGTHLTLELRLDLMNLAVALVIGLTSSKVWPLLNASLAVLTAATVTIQAVSPFSPWAYGITQGAWQMLGDALLLVAAWLSMRRRPWAARLGARAARRMQGAEPGGRAPPIVGAQ